MGDAKLIKPCAPRVEFLLAFDLKLDVVQSRSKLAERAPIVGTMLNEADGESALMLQKHRSPASVFLLTDLPQIEQGLIPGSASGALLTLRPM